MVPQGFAAPNAALNSTINRAAVLAKKLGVLGVIETGLAVGAMPPADVPLSGIPIAQAVTAGVGPDDEVHLVCSFVGNNSDNVYEVAVLENVLASPTVNSVIALFQQLFPDQSTAQIEAKALTAIANIPSVASALASTLG